MKRLLLTSPSGKLGSTVLQHILDYDLIPTTSLILSSTSPHKVYNLAKQNDIPIVLGDYSDQATLQQSWSTTHADALFLVSYPSASIDRWLLHRNAIEAALACGMKLIIYTSLMFGGEDGMSSKADVMQAHIKTINYLKSREIDHVILRMGIYAEYWNVYAGFLPTPFREIDANTPIEAVIPADGPVAWIAMDDLGAATARILAFLIKDERPDWINRSLRLTGPTALTIAEVCTMAETSTGQKIDLRIVGKEAARSWHLAKAKEAGRPEWLVENWLTWYDALADGECAIQDGLVEVVLGGKARKMDDMWEDLFASV